MFAAISAAALLAVNAAPAAAQTVKITGIGSHDSEFCRHERAMLFEDPDGMRLLFDPGFTVAGAKDPRLGKIDVVLLSSVHGDHLSSARQAQSQREDARQQYRRHHRRQEG